MIGNSKYPPGFDINSISTVEVITNPKSKYVYIYTLSDFLYQFLFIMMNPNGINQILTKLNIEINSINSILELILALREFFLNFDIEGTRIFKFKKSQLFKKDIILSTVVGEPPYGTLNLSNIPNGFGSYTNVYTWCATSCKNNYYFGTLDIRSQIYFALVSIISSILNIPGLFDYLITLPQDQIIIITELLNPNFCIGSLTDLSNKKLYFDIINIKSCQKDQITSSGFNTIDGLNPIADDGVRNLNIISHKHENYLLIGTTCYQESNVAKNYLKKIVLDK